RGERGCLGGGGPVCCRLGQGFGPVFGHSLGAGRLGTHSLGACRLGGFCSPCSLGGRSLGGCGLTRRHRCHPLSARFCTCAASSCGRRRTRRSSCRIPCHA